MYIELTDQERLQAQQGQPVDVIDSRTNEAYILIARQRYEQVCTIQPVPTPEAKLPEQEIPEGIRLAQEAYRRDLPGLLNQKKFFRHWVAYHRNDRLGIWSSGHELLEKCLELGLSDDEFYIGWIDRSGLEVEEEVEPRMHHFAGVDDENP